MDICPLCDSQTMGGCSSCEWLWYCILCKPDRFKKCYACNIYYCAQCNIELSDYKHIFKHVVNNEPINEPNNEPINEPINEPNISRNQFQSNQIQSNQIQKIFNPTKIRNWKRKHWNQYHWKCNNCINESLVKKD